MEGEGGERKRGARLCCVCKKSRASVKRPKTLEQICRECFYDAFESEIHQVILENKTSDLMVGVFVAFIYMLLLVFLLDQLEYNNLCAYNGWLGCFQNL